MSYEQVFELVDKKLQQDLLPGYQIYPHPKSYNWIIIQKHNYSVPNGLYCGSVIKILKQYPNSPLNAMDAAILFHELGHHVWWCRKRTLSDRSCMQQNRWLVIKEEWGAWNYGWQELEKLWHKHRKELTITALWMMLLTPYCLIRYFSALYIDRVDKFNIEV